MEKKQYFLIIIIPALIAGLFAFTPTLYEKITEPRTKFHFSITQGPAVLENNTYKSIRVLKFSNPGQKPLTNIVGQLNLESGIIKTFSFSDRILLKPEIDNDLTQLRIHVKNMLPADSLSMSILVESEQESPLLNVSLRSNELVAKDISRDVTSTTTYPTYLSALFAAFSVLLMLLVSTKSKLIQRTVFIMARNYKNDLMFYICVLLKDFNISKIVLDNEFISYMRMSDLLFHYYQVDNDEKYTKAQFCLFIIEEMLDISRKTVKGNLIKMNLPEISDSDEKIILKKIKKEYLVLRDEFDKVFELGVEKYIQFKKNQA